MKYSVEYRDEIEADLQEIMDWYYDQKIGLDLEFIESFKLAIAQIIENPFLYRIRTRKPDLNT